MTTSSLPFTCDESSLCGSDIEHIVASKKRSESPNALLTVTEVHYFRNKTSDDNDDDDDDDDDESSVALVSIVASEPLRARGDGDMIGTTRFTVSKVLSSALDGDGEGRIACTFTPEGRENASSSCSLSENAKKYIAECIFKPFSEDNEKLFRIDGTCEIFCPMNGTNTGWHRDGFQSGCYIGHALCEEEREADDTKAAPADAAWFEFALIKQNAKDTSENDVQLDFCDSDHLLVQPSNFVAFTSRNAVSIFEDSKIYHRSPRVKSCWDSMERGARKIARFDFVGRDAGNILHWKMKKNETSRRETAAPTSVAVSQNASRLCELRRHLLCERREERGEEKDKDAIDVRFARYVNESSRPKR